MLKTEENFWKKKKFTLNAQKPKVMMFGETRGRKRKDGMKRGKVRKS